jgi:hypothetical protein
MSFQTVDLSGLNDAQREAVLHSPRGSLQVVLHVALRTFVDFATADPGQVLTVRVGLAGLTWMQSWDWQDQDAHQSGCAIRAGPPDTRSVDFTLWRRLIPLWAAKNIM